MTLAWGDAEHAATPVAAMVTAMPATSQAPGLAVT